MSLRLPFIELFRKSGLLLIFLSAIALTANAQGLFTPVASAVNTGGNCYRLTTETVSDRGAIWNNTKISLLSDFDITFTFNFGTRQGYQGGDGMAFVLQPAGLSQIGVAGSAKGWGNNYDGNGNIAISGISPSVVVDYDNYDDNGGSDALLSLLFNGDYRGTNPANVGVPQSSIGFVNDGQEHAQRIIWHAATKTLSVHTDGVLRFAYIRDFVNDIFSGQDEVYFGFTAATGGSVNQYSVCYNAELSTFRPVLIPTLGQVLDACAGGSTGSATINLQGGTNPFIIELNGVSHVFTQSNITSNSVTFSNLPADVYSVRILESNGYVNNDLSFTIHDNPTAFITASGPLTFCQGGSVVLTASTGTSYLWSTGETTPSITVTTSGIYNVTITNGSCVSTSPPFEILVNPSPATPTLALSGPSEFCEGGSVVISVTNVEGVAYQWLKSVNGGYADPIPGETASSITVTTTGRYTVMATNGCGTIASGTYEITVNAPPLKPTISASGSLVLCSYNSVVLTSSSATGNTWSNGETTQSITVTPATVGSYSVNVTNGSCSTNSDMTMVVNAPAFMSSITASGPTLICTGSSVTYTLNEPVPSVSRTWYRYADGSYDPTFNETGLSIVVTKSGNYGVNILDSYGCYSNPPGSHDVTVLPPPTKPLAFTVTGSGECTTNAGTVAAIIDFSSGVAPINMTWDDGNGFTTHAQSLNNVPAGIYTATVYDYCGTTVVKTFTVTGPVTPATISATATNVCAGNTSTLSVNNIDALLTYQWYVDGNPIIGATGTSYEASTAGNYQVLASNGGCSAYSNGILITISSPLTVNIISNETSCINGGGYAFANAVGGAAPVSFEGWTGPNGYTSNNPNISSLLVGTYTASYRDGCGNLASASVIINPATPVILPSITASKPYCVNGEDVVLTLGPTSYSFAWVEYDASNATQPYNWAFSPNQYSITVNKPGMQYYVVHTDANNCNSFSQGANFFTTLPSPISFSVTSSPSCGTNTGTAQIYNITGGKSPVTYSWTDGASFSSTNGFISNLSPGTYTVTAIDACSSAVSQSVTITGQITAATITTTTQNVCSGSSAVLSVTNFNPAYSYQWIKEGVIIPGATGASYSAASQGFYYVRVSDGVCSADANGIYIAVVATPSLTVYATPSCGSSNAGSAYIQSVSGGKLPFTYAWTDGNSFSSTSQVVNNLAAGNYTVTVTDACGAQDSKSVTINQFPAVIGTISGLPAICTLGGSTTLTASTNGTPASYAWHKTIAGVTSYDIASTPAISATEAGHYWVTIRDVNGCFSTPGVTVTAAGAPLTITVTGTVSCGPSSGSARVVYSGGTAPITVAWTNGGAFSSTSTQITQLAPGTYTATVTEGCGASIAQSFTVIAGQVISTTVSKSGPTTICSGDAVTLSAVYNSVVPAATYRWSRFDDGIMVNNYATAQSINVTEGGTYQVFVTNAYGCISSSPITDVFVTIPRTPTVVADGPLNLCPEGSVNLTATSNSNQSKYSLQFNGSNYVEAPHQSYMGLTKKLTVEAWFKTDDAGTVQYIVSKGIDDYTPGQYGLVLVNSKVEFHLFMNGIHQAVQSTTSIENGKWYHAAGTWDSTKIIMYVNGVAEGQKVFVGPMTANTEPLQIGRLGKPGALYNFKGEIDEVRIWNTALTEAQINTAKGLIVNYSNTMVANYRFEAGTGTTVADNGYGNPATMIGSPQWTVSTAPFYNYTPTYLWSPGGATTSTLNVNSAGSYTVTVNAGGCTNTSDPIIITSLPVATITASGSLTLLPGQTVTLTASAGTSYLWNNGATTQSIVVTTAEAGSYTVAVTNNGCNSTSNPTVVSAAATIAPVINVPADVSVNNDPGTCGAIVNFTATETTGIPASTITYSHAPGSIFPIGITTVTATATSAAGVSSNTFTVTVTDNEKPAFVIIAPGTATVTIPALQTTVGSCAPATFTFMDPLPAGAVVTGIDLNYSGQDQGWGYTDGTDDIYVSGTHIASSVYAHETKTFNTTYTGAIPGYVYGGNNIFGFVFICYPGWQGFINGGTMTIRYTTNFGSKTINSDAGTCGATVVLATPSTSDNCGVASVTNDAPATFPVGATNVTWTATDTHGNTNMITQAITVVDNQPPVVITKNITVQLSNGSATITAADINNGSTDNCGIVSYSLDKTSFDCSNVGTNTVTLTVTDIHGNSESATANVIVNSGGTQATITAGGPTTICTGSSVTLTASVGTGYLWSTGETSQSITVSQSGSYTVTVTDASGCSSVSANINVTVNTAPVVNPIVTASGSTTLCQGGNLGLSVAAMGGSSLRFNGSNYLEAPSAPGNSLSTAFTAELWFKTDNAAATQYLVSKGKSDGAPGQYGLVLVNSRVQLHLGGAGSASINSVTLLQSNTWYHVAGTWDGATGIARLYLNGSYEGQVTTGTNSNLGTNIEPLQIGRLGLSCCPYMFRGEMDEIRIWNVARDAGQIANGRSLSFGNTPNLVANYHFDEGTGAVTYDSAPGGSNATLVNTPTWQVSGAPVNAPTATYLWSNGETTPNISVNTAGSYTATVTYITADGCTATGTSAPVAVTTVSAATVTASGPVTFCPGGSVILTASTGSTYVWSNGATSQSITVTQSGNYTVTVTNGLGCTTNSAPVSVSVADITAPVPDLPSLPVISIAPNGLIPAPTATDDCSGVSITGTTTDQIINLLSGTYNIIWLFSDASGNTSTQTQTVIVADMAPPSLKAMNRIVKNNDPGVCGAMVTYVMPVANDNASTTKVTINEGGGDGVITFNTPLSQNVTSLDFISSGEYQDIVHGHGVDIAIQVELYNPQSGSWTLVQTVQTGTTDYHFGGTSVHFPAISQVSQIRFTASQPVYAAFHFYEMSVNLNSIAAVQTAGLPSGSVFPIGTTLNTFRAVDFSGNEAVTSFIVEVLDAEKPRMGNYTSVTYAAGANGTWTGSAATIAISDNCGSETLQLTEEYFDQRGNRFYQGQSAAAQGNLVLASRTFPVGTNTVVVSIRDAAGNISDRARFNVSITDITAPTIVVSGNMTQTADPGVCAAWVKVPIPVTSDNCSVQSVANSFNGSPSAAGRYPVGTTVVTWTVTDGSGNKTTAVQTITVIDNEAPVLINVPVSMIQTNDAGSCGAVVTWDAVRATDNCGLISFVSDHQSGEIFPLGVTVVTFTATDRNGNIGRSSFTITVKDNEAPKVITRPVTVTLVNGSATIIPSAINNGSTDNCSAVTLAASKTVFTCADAGVNKVTLTVSDANGNVSSAVALVTVIGEAPTSAITVVPSNTIYTGGVPTDIYLGYGPQSVTLNTTVTGTVPVSYSWTGSSGLSCTTCANPVFTPTAAGSYSFTVVATNSYGCTTSSTVTICVRDIRVPNSNGRVYVCHTDLNTGVTTTLSLATNTVANQLLQNPQDKLGSCGMALCSQVIVTAAPDVPKTISTGVVEKMTKETSGSAITGLAVKASPNPTNDVFTFMITSPGKLPVHIRLLNEAGKMEESRSNIQLGSAFTMGRSLHSGVYFAEVIQGKERVVVKLIKMVR